MALQLMLLCLLVAAALRLTNLTETPPGLHYDEAANGILAAEIGRGDERPIFIASYTGKEVLFFYLAGGLMRTIGASIFTLRLASAFIGLLTIAVTYWLGVELFGDRRLAVLTAILLAVGFWQVLFSRLGFRAINQPLLQALAIAALFRGLRRDSWPWLALAGLFLGLTAYTYLAARVFPIPLLLASLPLLAGRCRRPGRWRQLALAVVVAFVVLLPLIIYFLRQPETFWVRIGQVGPAGNSFAFLVSSYLESLGMIFLNGDPYWRFNIPFQPIMHILWGILLIAGWLYLIVHYRKLSSDWRRAAYLLLLLIPFFMLLPTALAVGEIVPSNLRAIGLAPFLYFLPAVGFFQLVTWIQRLVERLTQHGLGRFWIVIAARQLDDQKSVLTVVILSLVLLVGAVTTAQAYFVEWRVREDLYYDSDADLVEVARYLEVAGLDQGTLFVTALHYRHPTIAFLSNQYDRLKWLPKSQALAFPAEGPATYIFSHNSPLPEWAASFFPAEPSFKGPDGPDGEPTFAVYHRSQSPVPSPSVEANANFGNEATLLGYDLGAATSGDTMPVTLYWRVEKPPSGNYVPFLHLEDEWGYRWSQKELSTYPAEQWTAGDVFIQQVEVPIPPGMPPAVYRLRVGLFNPDDGQQLAHLDSARRYAGNSFTIDDIRVTDPSLPGTAPEIPHELNQIASPDLTLLGFERGVETVMTGAPFWLSLWWEATAPLSAMTTRLELVAPNNVGRILLNSQPVHGTYPFSDWTEPQFIIDHQMPQVPESLPPGDYELRMRLMSDAEDTLMTAGLGKLTVETADRLFNPPKSQFPLAATFGEEISLLGYSIEKKDPDRYELSLVWQALKEPAKNYTVFVHVLDPDGNCCVWQQDIQPQQGIYPTGRWIAGEVVVDEYVIELPDELSPGNYLVEVGLYLPETGRRLLVRMPGIVDNDALILRPLVAE